MGVSCLPLADDASKLRERDNLPKVNGRAKERRKIMDAKFHLRQLSLRLVFLFLLCPSLCITGAHIQIICTRSGRLCNIDVHTDAHACAPVHTHTCTHKLKNIFKTHFFCPPYFGSFNPSVSTKHPSPAAQPRSIHC